MPNAGMTPMSPLRVAVVAASSQARASLQALVDATPTLDFAGSAADAAAIADRFAGEWPDVVLVELEPQAGDWPMSGADRHPAMPALVLLTDDADGDWIHDALAGGATALLPRGATPGEITAAIEAVAAGLCVLSPETLARLLAQPKAPRQTASATLVEMLTPREIEVLTMLAEGLGNKEIARQLDISDNTVKFHLSSIFGKLGASSRTEAVMQGMRHGLIMV
ncbi:helix-turn-helix transcriptional regulator [Burkholderia ubonensis]|nr:MULTISPECIES: response regulator transcription factor [Burkholderia]KIP15009.1 bacterial regulatory s, luxR family protein [Burkholderia sp. MSHR3999]KVP23797.1 helix-turn-helix transcriptional regulator [Burkholderia ubonensis]KVP32432.1 helix-turn-helix transcriptional regulator [Burkholderia ubonensis]KVU86644.1 helix-turn-helix transcriptional regulator [Burkholderia ubonensis]KWB62123.1 helix-turn-helix transcriptional regulator [Burkholderia ubonensis]